MPDFGFAELQRKLRDGTITDAEREELAALVTRARVSGEQADVMLEDEVQVNGVRVVRGSPEHHFQLGVATKPSSEPKDPEPVNF